MDHEILQMGSRAYDLGKSFIVIGNLHRIYRAYVWIGAFAVGDRDRRFFACGNYLFMGFGLPYEFMETNSFKFSNIFSPF